MIGTITPSKQGEQPMIGTLAPSGSNIIGGYNMDPIIKQTEQALKQAEPIIPQIQQQTEQAARQVEPMIPQIRQAAQQAVQQGQDAAALNAPEQNEPIVITPRSVRAGNASNSNGSGRRNNNRSSYGAGYSGGNGQGPLIYNP